MTDKAVAFISDLMTTMSNCALYSKEHPSVARLGHKAVGLLEALYDEGKVSIALFGDRIVINEAPMVSKNLHVTGFMKKPRRKGIDKVIITKGVTGAELKEFLSEPALSDRVAGSYPHISSGIIEVNLAGEGIDAAGVMQENAEKVREMYHRVSRFKEPDTTGLEDVVSSFIAMLRQEADVLNVVSPIRAHSEYTYVHNTNVSVLSIFQAESLGIGKELLHDIGLAGLLHDIGKMFVPKEVLEKEVKLDNQEWMIMKRHPVYGAMYLATLPDIPKFALVAACEHHMKFNGTGYPDTGSRPKAIYRLVGDMTQKCINSRIPRIPPQIFGTLGILVKDDTIVARDVKRKVPKNPKNQDAQEGCSCAACLHSKSSPASVAHLAFQGAHALPHLLYKRFERFQTGFLGFFLPFDKTTRNETVESVAELCQQVRKFCAVYLPVFGA